MRFLFSSLRHQSSFYSAFRKRFGHYPRSQSRGYAGSQDYKNRRPDSQLHAIDDQLESESQSWQYFTIPAALLVAAGVGLAIHYNDERRSIKKGSQQGTTSRRNTVNRPAFGGPFTLLDTENHLVNERDFLGDWTLMYFGYTSSPDVGPEEVQKMAKANQILDTKYNMKVNPVFVTIDPQRDTISQLKAYLQEFDPRIIGLTGPINSIRQMAHEYASFLRKLKKMVRIIS
ncbi:hypothetical protein QJS10_CPB19g01429 [Acorus calamus]|uniref:Uncharacterized protein n=1 Tax=Acorus calamus TaxID=4465 RepID=A0AAV9CFM4_ACOCL|nr:hypothetical protein QJS10_CPB19g01429 [Acorus calamus]